MRLAWSASVSKIRKDQKFANSRSRSRKKHKRLDAICEQEYNRCHREVKAESSECNAGGENESELRRSTRVRRAPVVLDASPPPAKKRRKIDKSGADSAEKAVRKNWVKSESPCSTSKDSVEESGNWRARLRNRAKNLSSRGRKKGDSSPKGKRKLFEDLDGFKEEPKLKGGDLDGKKEGMGSERSTVVKSKRPGRIKASNVLRNGHQEISLVGVKEDDQGKNEVDVLEDKRENRLLLKTGLGCGNEGEVRDNNAVTELVEDIDNVEHMQQDKHFEEPGFVNDGENHRDSVEDCVANDCVQSVDQNKQVEQPGQLTNGESERDAAEVGRVPNDEAGNGGCIDGLLEDKNFKDVDKMNYTSTDVLGKPRIKEGRRCGLCGGGTDGRPPKPLVQDGVGSDTEAYSGSSASEEPNYDIWDGFGDEPGWLGGLLGPINDRYGIARIWVHQHCAVWSPEVYFAGLKCLKNVRAALCRGRVLKCSRCGRSGATIGCRVDRCSKTYHLPCARAVGCIFDHRKFLIACTDHRHLFQPHGSIYLYRLKKLKAKKMKLEMRKLSNDAWRKDLETEEKWFENCGEDEEFLKRESKRLHRDLLRIAPVYIGGSKSKSEIQFQGWESVAGLQGVIQCLKEVAILPLLYPEFFDRVGLTPPRGVLLHGYPGTGKTLVVRALVGACARGDKRIAYFARKGADCLGKYVGDAERQLRLLFQVAEKSQPSIIFFDEIDGLAPCRTSQQDQTHSSVVSTLLALMDGLKSRGSVVVIGATNRPDAVDPALRRPGRFDREIYFPLPSSKDREAILSLHTKNWPQPVTGSLLKWIARRAVGFAGADLQALCTQAAIIALRRSCPLQKLLSAAGEKDPHGRRPPLPNFVVEERDWLEALSSAPPPCSLREAGMAANDVVSLPLPDHLIPCLLQPLCRLLVSFYLDERVWLPTPLSKAANLIKTVFVSALDKRKVRSDCWWFHVNDLLQEVDVTNEIESKLSNATILVGDASFDTLDDDTNDDSTKFKPFKVQDGGTSASLRQNLSHAFQKKSGFRILISGNPTSGQRHLTSCILHCFAGNVEIRKVDLATMRQEGHGDVVQGVTQILMGCASGGSCMIFMPRIDSWAVEACYQAEENETDYPSTNLESTEEENSCLIQSEVSGTENNSCVGIHRSAEISVPQDVVLSASHLWDTFIEQVESICVSTPLMIMATSEVLFPLLPPRIRQFFGTDTLSCSLSTPLVDAVPRFSMQVDGNFNRDMVIDSSAAKLSKDLAQHFVQLIHHRTHIYASSFEEHKTCDTVENEADTVCHGLNPVSAIEHGSTKQCPGSPVLMLSLAPNKRNVKGKSNLLLEISTFGYQILRYPQFAELCWVTSKLKEGPCADIKGPWKGWPFNSCITRPNDSLEKVVVTCSSSIIKSKEKYGTVRGLIAVGLSAFRGVYTSPKEVSYEVRNVLQLLAGHINAKIQAGKDRCQFIHLLSQVAILQDMVNSWVYSLRSLEADADLTEANPKLEQSLDRYDTCKDNLIETDECKPAAPYQSSCELDVLKENGEPDDNNNGYVSLEGDDDSGHPNMERIIEGDSAPIIHMPSYPAPADKLDVNLLNSQNGVTFEPCRPESSGNHAQVGGDFGFLKQSNGFALTDPVILPEGNGLSSSEINIPFEDGSANPSQNSFVNLSPNRSAGRPTDCGAACLYHCCSACLFNLHCLMHKILIHKFGLKGSNWTVQDAHDIISSVSANLHSAVFLAESSINLFGKNPKHDKYKKMFEVRETGICQCKNYGDGLILPMECTCHSRSKSVTPESNDLWSRLDSEFIYRDGVLADVDPEKDVSFHCKFENLCLCSLIEWLVMTKQPSD